MTETGASGARPTDAEVSLRGRMYADRWSQHHGNEFAADYEAAMNGMILAMVWFIAVNTRGDLPAAKRQINKVSKLLKAHVPDAARRVTAQLARQHATPDTPAHGHRISLDEATATLGDIRSSDDPPKYIAARQTNGWWRPFTDDDGTVVGYEFSLDRGVERGDTP